MERLGLEGYIEHQKQCLEKLKTKQAECKYNDDCINCATACYDEQASLETHIEWLEKLHEYQTLEKQDLLIKTPCKIGDVVYVISRGKVIPVIVAGFSYTKYGLAIHAKNEEHWGYGNITLYPDKRCVEWYKTEEEAKQMLN